MHFIWWILDLFVRDRDSRIGMGKNSPGNSGKRIFIAVLTIGIIAYVIFSIFYYKL